MTRNTRAPMTRLAACLVGALIMSFPLDAETVAKAASTDTAAEPSDAQLAATRCAIGEEKVVPGDYYYCLGQQTYGEQHYGYAKKFFTTAASWASKPAQYVLAVMALDGDHQPVNRPLALAWLALASERPGSRFRHAYDQLNAVATKAEEKSAAEWLTKLRPTYADATAAVRAEERYAQGMATIRRIQATAGTYCMDGTADLADSSDTQPDPTRCPPVQHVVNALNETAANLFDGWLGHVSVGPLQAVHAAAGAGKNAKQDGQVEASKSASGT